LKRTENSYGISSFIFFIGTVLYELLTQKTPYNTRMTAEYYAQNEIIKAVSPDTLNPLCPESLAKVVMQCIEIEPRLRYSNFERLKGDLYQCLNQVMVKNQGESSKFKKEIASKILYSQLEHESLVELDELKNAFERVNDVSCEFTLVTGDTELAKTNIIYQFQKNIVYNNGYLCLSEFNANKKNAPFNGILNALKHLALQLNGETDDVVARYRKELAANVFPYGDLLGELLPELRSYFVSEGESKKIGKASEQDIAEGLKKFLNYFSSIGISMVMILDSIHFADPYSIRFMQEFWGQDQIKKFLLVSSYKINELISNPSALAFIEHLKEGFKQRVQLNLKKMTVQEFTLLISDMLGTPEIEIEPLAQVLYRKAHGLPLIGIHLIKMMFQEKYLEYSALKKGWNWDINSIENYSSVSNMSDLIFAKFSTLDKLTQQMVKIASVIGLKFDLTILTTLLHQTEQKTMQHLVPAQYDDLIQKRFDSFIYSTNPNKRVMEKTVYYSFVNIVAHRLIYSLMAKNEREEIHYQIATILYNHFTETMKVDKTVEIAHHFNACIWLIKDPKEKEKIVKLNLDAALVLKGEGKFNEAMETITQGIDILPEDKWKKDYTLTKSLYSVLSEIQLLAGNVKDSNKTFMTIFGKTSSREDKLKLLMERISLYGQLNLYDDAFKTVVEAVKLFNVTFLDKPSKLRIIMTYIKLKIMLKFRTIEQLKNLPIASNKDAYLLGSIYDSTMHICWASGRAELLAYTSFKMMELFLRYGVTEYTSMALAVYSSILMTNLSENYKIGLELGKLSKEIGSRYPESHVTIKAAITYYLFFNRWAQSVHANVPALREWAEKAFAAGGNCDIYGVGALVGLGNYSLLSGVQLKVFLEETEKNLEILQRYQTPSGLATLQAFKEFCFYIMNGNAVRKPFDKGSDESLQSMLESAKEPLIIFRLSTWKVAKLVIMKRYDAAYREGEKVLEYVSRFPYESTWSIYYFYYFFAVLENYRTTSNKNAKDLKLMKNITKKFTHWTKYSPENFQHKEYLLHAEYSLIDGDSFKAGQLFEKALQAAKDNKFEQDEAFIYERAVEYYRIINKEKAINYLKASIDKYRQWGATSKVMFLESEYANISSLQKEHIRINISRPISTP
jgi:predicted ATPase